jgi:rod shape-determining protein MreD
MDRTAREWRLPMLSLLIALALAIVPLPRVVEPYWPDWVALVLIYWSLDSAPRFGLLTAFLAGLMLDTLSGALLGQHALALLIVVYLSQRFYLRFRVFPMSQMAITVVVLLALHEFVLFWADGMAGRTVPIVERWGPVLSGALVWPLLLGYLDRVRRDRRAHI